MVDISTKDTCSDYQLNLSFLPPSATVATILVAWAGALAGALVGMDMSAADHLSVADTGPTDFTEKPQKVLWDSLLSFLNPLSASFSS